MDQFRPKRPSADGTRKKILQAATHLFMQHGYAGTSMAKLAEKAGINQSLIFHHFGDKKQLWKQVKTTAIAGIDVAPISQKPETIEQFLCEVIDQSVLVYTQCPHLAKLVAWQRLESPHNKHGLAGIANSLIGPTTWTAAIKYLQKNHLLDPKLKPELVMIWLTASVDGMINDDIALFKNNPKNKKHYVHMLTSSLAKGLGVS